jgi:hypothetical protein
MERLGESRKVAHAYPARESELGELRQSPRSVDSFAGDLPPQAEFLADSQVPWFPRLLTSATHTSSPSTCAARQVHALGSDRGGERRRVCGRVRRCCWRRTPRPMNRARACPQTGPRAVDRRRSRIPHRLLVPLPGTSDGPGQSRPWYGEAWHLHRGTEITTGAVQRSRSFQRRREKIAPGVRYGPQQPAPGPRTAVA